MTGVGDAETARADEAFRAEPATLYVVATPIGNLRDVTLRALDILRSVDVILAEDTRVTATLLGALRRSPRGRARCIGTTRRAKSSARVREIADGRSVALVSDAGTPAISDPGARLVRAVAAGRPSRRADSRRERAGSGHFSGGPRRASRFAFIGFLPTQAKARRAVLATYARAAGGARVLRSAAPRSPRRCAISSQALDGRRMLTVARELTKTFETIAPMPLADAPAWLDADPNRSRGEFVLIVDAAPSRRARERDVDRGERAARQRCSTELPPSRAARVAAKITGLPRDAALRARAAR